MSGVFEAFSAALAPTVLESLAEHRSRIESAIEGGIENGIARWPGVVVPVDAFARAFGRSLSEAPDPVAAVETLHTADLYLAAACVLGARNALAAFETEYQGSIHSAVRSLGLEDHAMADVAQQVREKLFVQGKIATYSARASLDSWVRTIATRTAISSRRRRTEAPIDDQVMNALPSTANGPDEEHFRVTYHADFKQAFEDAMASLTPQQRNLLRHRFVDGLAVEAIGGLYGVHKGTASRWIEGARTLLAKRTRNAFQQRTRATPSEMRSIIRILESNVELSLRRVLT